MSLWLSPAALTATQVNVPVSLSWALGSASTRPPDSTCNGSTAPSATPRGQTQAGGALRAHFKMKHLLCHSFPPSPCTPVFSFNADWQKQNSNFMPVPRNCWHSQDFAGSHQLQTCCHTFRLCPELSSQNTNSTSSPSDYKNQFPKTNHSLLVTSEISSSIRGQFSFLNYHRAV